MILPPPRSPIPPAGGGDGVHRLMPGVAGDGAVAEGVVALADEVLILPTFIPAAKQCQDVELVAGQ